MEDKKKEREPNKVWEAEANVVIKISELVKKLKTIAEEEENQKQEK